jgi:hypothetical protein
MAYGGDGMAPTRLALDDGALDGERHGSIEGKR